jgi:hypothetical protein
LKIPVVAVASCSAESPKAPRRRSSKSSVSIVDETTSSGVQPLKTRSLESSKRKRKTSEQVSDAELQAASSLAHMSRKKAKKAVTKVVSSEVRRVPYAFGDDLFVESSQKGSFFWPLLQFNFLEHCPSGSKNEFVDIGSFSDAAPEIQKEVVSAVAAEPLLLLLTLSFLSLFVLRMKLLLNSLRSWSLPFTGVRIPSRMLPWSKFVKILLKTMFPLLLWLPLTRALVRPTVVNY